MRDARDVQLVAESALHHVKGHRGRPTPRERRFARTHEQCGRNHRAVCDDLRELDEGGAEGVQEYAQNLREELQGLVQEPAPAQLREAMDDVLCPRKHDRWHVDGEQNIGGSCNILCFVAHEAMDCSNGEEAAGNAVGCEGLILHVVGVFDKRGA